MNLLNTKNELTIDVLSVCCKLNKSVNVIKQMIDGRDEFREYQNFSREEVEGFIET